MDEVYNESLICTFCENLDTEVEAAWIIQPKWKHDDGRGFFGNPASIPVCLSCYDAFRRAADYARQQTFLYERL